MNVMLDIPYIGRETCSTDDTLMQILFQCHRLAALNNDNASGAACTSTTLLTNRLENGIAAGILTLGETHAPLVKARDVYENWDEVRILQTLRDKQKVPGFGNSFFKKGIDPAFYKLDWFLEVYKPHIHVRIGDLKNMLWKHGVVLYPNAALYTAAVCSDLKVIRGSEVSLFILARLPTWVNNVMGGKSLS